MRAYAIFDVAAVVLFFSPPDAYDTSLLYLMLSCRAITLMLMPSHASDFHAYHAACSSHVFTPLRLLHADIYAAAFAARLRAAAAAMPIRHFFRHSMPLL